MFIVDKTMLQEAQSVYYGEIPFGVAIDYENIGIAGNRHETYPLGQFGIAVPHRMCRTNRSRSGCFAV